MNDLSLGLSSFTPNTFFGSSILSFLGRGISYFIKISYPVWKRVDLFLCNADKTKSFFHRFTLGYLIVAKKHCANELIESRECPDILRTPINTLANKNLA